LNPITRNDRHDTHLAELKLIRTGHALWAIWKKERRKSGYVEQQCPILAALRTVWDLKAQVRAELKARRAAKSEVTREYFKKLKEEALAVQ
jgi:hypothetical protein